MKLKVKLFATLRKNNAKEQLLEVAEGTTPAHIMKRLGIPEEEVAIIMVNGRHSKADTKLVETDILALFPPVGGG